LIKSIHKIAVAAFFLGGCASYTDQMREVEDAYRGRNYELALTSLEKTDLKEQERNRLLYFLEKGVLLDRSGAKKESRNLWVDADKLSDRLYTTSLSKEAATYIFNESTQAYAGEDFEKVAIHAMLAHSFLEEGDLAGSRVEAARINTKLAEINNSYGENNKNAYKEDAYARLLSAMIYESLGEDDSAIVDYKNAIRVYESSYAKEFQTSAPPFAARALYRLYLQRNRKDEAKQLAEKFDGLAMAPLKSDRAELVVVHEVGTINHKERKEFVLPIGDSIVRFSYPVIRPGSPSFGRTGVRVDDGPFEAAILAQNFNQIAHQTLEDKRLRIVAKSAARLILKGQLTQKAEKEFGPLGWLAGNIYGAVTETADTRSWTTLPASIYVTRLVLKPGSYDLSIENNGRLSHMKKVVLKAGQLRILRDY
jgi:hypothetical protein